jgi:hypothetical protein
MFDRIVSIFTIMIVGGTVVRIMTNKQSQGTVSAIFHGLGEDISASFGN